MTLRYLQANRPNPPARSLAFHAQITALLRGDVRCSSAFSCVGRANAFAYAYIRCDEAASDLVWSRMTCLAGTAADPLAVASADDLARCAIRRSGRASEKDAWDPDDGRAIAVVLESRGQLLGVAGLRRARSEAPFSADEWRDIQSRAGAAGWSAHFHVEREQVACELAAFDALGRSDGLMLMVDRPQKQIFWAYRHGGGVDWANEVEAIASPLLSAIEKVLAQRSARVCLDGPTKEREVEAVLVPERHAGLGHCVAVRVSEACIEK
jgi:hypothetical protein